MDGLERFQSSANIPNQALLYGNLGSLMRSCAEAHGVALGEEGRRGEFSPQEKLYYGKAAEFYIQGKQVREGALIAWLVTQLGCPHAEEGTRRNKIFSPDKFYYA